jgi:hypothetical protein
MAVCERLAKEIAYRESIGCERLSVAEFGRRFAALGYRIDRTMDCRSSARYVTGPRAGESYPACDTGINEADTGLRAWNYAARRDAAFQAMQELRQQVFAVTRDGFILEV